MCIQKSVWKWFDVYWKCIENKVQGNRAFKNSISYPRKAEWCFSFLILVLCTVFFISSRKHFGIAFYKYRISGNCVCFTLRNNPQRLWKSSRHASDEILFFSLSFHFVLILLLGCSCCCFCSPLPSFVRIAFWCDFIYVFILSFRVRFFSTLFWVCNARTTFEPHSRSVNLSSQSHCNASTVEILHMNHTIKWTDRLCI